MVGNNSIEFTFHMDNAIPVDDCLELLDALSSPDVGAEVGIYGAGPMEEFMAAVTIISTAMTAVQIARTAASKIIQWRQKLQQKGIPAKARIEGKDESSINLEIDADNVVVNFITIQITESQRVDVPKDTHDTDA